MHQQRKGDDSDTNRPLIPPPDLDVGRVEKHLTRVDRLRRLEKVRSLERSGRLKELERTFPAGQPSSAAYAA